MKNQPTFQFRQLLLALALFIVFTVPSAESTHAYSLRKPLAQEQTAVYLPLVSNVAPKCTKLTATVFGTQMYGDTSKNSPYHADLVASQTAWIRSEISWLNIEPVNTTPENYNWSSVDLALAAAKDGCFNLIATQVYAPSWAATSPAGPIDKTPLTDFAEFMGAVVERFDGDGKADAPGSPVVSHWEMYNEPDATPILPDQPSWAKAGAKYAEMLKAIYPAVKAANPNAQVLMGGIAFDLFEDQGGTFVRSFINEVLQAGGGDYFDIMNFHCYPAFAKNWTQNGGTGLPEKTQTMRRILNDYKVTKPFMITEMGWHNNNAPTQPSDNETQARYVVELFVQSLASNIQMAIWWPFVDIEGYQFEMGLVTYSTPHVRKPVFPVHVLLTQQLRTATFVKTWSRSETGADDLEVHEFNDSVQNRTLIVAWVRPINTTATHKLSIAAGTAQVRDIYGAVSTVTDAADGSSDGKINVTVGGRPLNIEVTK